MITNLAVAILQEVVHKSAMGKSPVSLSAYRKFLGCPNSTFYRHVNQLIQARMIARVARDQYVIHSMFLIDLIYIAEEWRESLKEEVEYLPDFQKEMEF